MNVQIRARARIGRDCILGKDVFIDEDVKIGNRCKIQNGVSLYRGVTAEDGVFMGPHSVTTNDLNPAAINLDGSLKGEKDWFIGRTLLKSGCRIGANATLICGSPMLTVGTWSLVGAGSVVTNDVADFALVLGNPARLVRYVCPRDLRHRVALHESALRCEQCARELTQLVDGSELPLSLA